MKHALVQGAGRGIGLALASRLIEQGEHHVTATCRAGTSAGLERLAQESNGRLRTLALDSTRPETIETAAAQIDAPIDLLLNVGGFLHDDEHQPEKRLESLDAEQLTKSFAVNAIGPLLLVQAVFPLLRQAEHAVIANLSARVGSISDNRSGGWYGYRASKAALNMMTRTLAIELRRRAPEIVCVALHPGTVDTDLSRPFRGGIPPGQRFSAEQAAGQLLRLTSKLRPEQTGRFLAYDGKEITW